jgi:hypothetical protein
VTSHLEMTDGVSPVATPASARRVRLRSCQAFQRLARVLGLFRGGSLSIRTEMVGVLGLALFPGSLGDARLRCAHRMCQRHGRCLRVALELSRERVVRVFGASASRVRAVRKRGSAALAETRRTDLGLRPRVLAVRNQQSASFCGIGSQGSELRLRIRRIENKGAPASAGSARRVRSFGFGFGRPRTRERRFCVNAPDALGAPASGSTGAGPRELASAGTHSQVLGLRPRG